MTTQSRPAAPATDLETRPSCSRLMKGVRHGRAEDDRRRRRAPGDDRAACRSIRSRPSPARCSSSTRPTCGSTRPGSSSARAGSRAAAATRSSSCGPVVPGRAARRSCASRRPSTSRWTSCPAATLCSASFKGRVTGAGDPRRGPRRAAAPQAVLEGPAGVLQGARARRARPRRAARCSGRRSSEVRVPRPTTSWAAASSPSCGSTRTARGSSSCRPSACRARPSRSWPREPAPYLEDRTASPSGAARSRRRPRRPSSSSAPTCARPARRDPQTSPWAGRGSTPTARSCRRKPTKRADPPGGSRQVADNGPATRSAA